MKCRKVSIRLRPLIYQFIPFRTHPQIGDKYYHHSGTYRIMEIELLTTEQDKKFWYVGMVIE